MSARGFASLAYVEYSLALLATSNVITLEVATVSTDVLVLYYMAGARGFLAIEIIAGLVHVSFAPSGGPVTRVVGLTAVSDWLWHQIQVLRSTTVCYFYLIPISRYYCSL